MNHTQANIYVNPVDVATVIDLLEMLVNTQAHVIVLEVTGWTDAKRTYARAEKDFPRLEETEEFMNVSIKVKIQWYLKCFIRKCLKLRHLGVLNFPLPTRTFGRPRWLSWMRRPTGDQKVAGSTPAEVGNILSWRLIMKYFLRSFSPFR